MEPENFKPESEPNPYERFEDIFDNLSAEERGVLYYLLADPAYIAWYADHMSAPPMGEWDAVDFRQLRKDGRRIRSERHRAEGSDSATLEKVQEEAFHKLESSGLFRDKITEMLRSRWTLRPDDELGELT